MSDFDDMDSFDDVDLCELDAMEGNYLKKKDSETSENIEKEVEPLQVVALTMKNEEKKKDERDIGSFSATENSKEVRTETLERHVIGGSKAWFNPKTRQDTNMHKTKTSGIKGQTSLDRYCVGSTAQQKLTKEGRDVVEADMGHCGFSEAQKISEDTVETWIYPRDMERREYQFNIVRAAIFQNTLVCLPTGLGKTFIAAVVMYNYYRWFPRGQIIFMAPTRPLVAQQMDACHASVGFATEDTALMNGTVPPERRRKLWDENRLFFVTPQIVVNDLNTIFNADRVVLLIVDEAHRALKNYAYVKAVEGIAKACNGAMRVVALSATPGEDVEQVQSVITNLRISKLLVRTEDALDVRSYTRDRDVEIVNIPESNEIGIITGLFRSACSRDGPFTRLHEMRLIHSDNLDRLRPFTIINMRNSFRSNGSSARAMGSSLVRAVEGDFVLAIQLAHAFKILRTDGLQSFHSYLETRKWLDAPSKSQAARSNRRLHLLASKDWQDMIEILKAFLAKGFLHPKFLKLREIVEGHFASAQHAGEEDGDRQGTIESDTRVIVFCQHRNAVSGVVHVLGSANGVRAVPFIGHASSIRSVGGRGRGRGSNNTRSGRGGGSGGLTTKKQKQVMESFRSGEYNTLVSTIVGEEGIDIGEVDLIVCFDANNSPKRMIQRMGRTGRRRKGRIVILASEGVESGKFQECQKKGQRIYKALGGEFKFRFVESPRIFPEGVFPRCVEAKVNNVSGNRKKNGVGVVAQNPMSMEHVKLMIRERPSLTRKLDRQNVLGPIHVIPHSRKTRLLVKICAQVEDGIHLDMNFTDKLKEENKKNGERENVTTGWEDFFQTALDEKKSQNDVETTNATGDGRESRSQPGNEEEADDIVELVAEVSSLSDFEISSPPPPPQRLDDIPEPPMDDHRELSEMSIPTTPPRSVHRSPQNIPETPQTKSEDSVESQPMVMRVSSDIDRRRGGRKKKVRKLLKFQSLSPPNSTSTLERTEEEAAMEPEEDIVEEEPRKARKSRKRMRRQSPTPLNHHLRRTRNQFVEMQAIAADGGDADASSSVSTKANTEDLEFVDDDSQEVTGETMGMYRRILMASHSTSGES